MKVEEAGKILLKGYVILKSMVDYAGEGIIDVHEVWLDTKNYNTQKLHIVMNSHGSMNKTVYDGVGSKIEKKLEEITGNDVLIIDDDPEGYWDSSKKLENLIMSGNGSTEDPETKILTKFAKLLLDSATEED